MVRGAGAPTGRGRGRGHSRGRGFGDDPVDDEEEMLNMLPRSMRNQAAKARALDELRESNEFLNIAKDVAAQRAQDLVKVRRDSMIEANAAEAAVAAAKAAAKRRVSVTDSDPAVKAAASVTADATSAGQEISADTREKSPKSCPAW